MKLDYWRQPYPRDVKDAQRIRLMLRGEASSGSVPVKLTPEDITRAVGKIGIPVSDNPAQVLQIEDWYGLSLGAYAP